MDTSQYDAAIEKLSQDIEEQKKQLEATRYEIRDLIEEIAIYWFKKEVQKTLASDPERSKKLGVEGLRPLRSDLDKLIASVPELVEQITTDKYWSHCRTLPTEPFQSQQILDSEYPSVLYNNLRKLLWHIAPILPRYGFKVNGYSDQKYDSGLTFPEEIDKKLRDVEKRYKEQYRSLNTLNGKLISTKREKSDAEINDLWSKVA
jgi:uncharacterized coiled-coil protein SlyX